ncbi:MAG: ferrous iron transport protein B [Fimbriimonadaceae bacterium]|nr:ferrous iron transport protein B [Fimbriimonadaceae bacterium]
MSSVRTRSARVVLVGNPNAGKTTLFNRLTGASQKVANYPGVTVESVVGTLRGTDSSVTVVDVPGLYSLKTSSEDERVAADVALGKDGEPVDLVVYVLDATNLARNLFLFSQLAETEVPILVALTMTDRMGSAGQRVQLDALQAALDAPVVDAAGDVAGAIERTLAAAKPPSLRLPLTPEVEREVDALRELMARRGVDSTRAEIRQDLFNPAEEFQAFLHDFPEVRESFEAARDRLERLGMRRPSVDVAQRYRWADEIAAQVIATDAAPKVRRRTGTERLDAFLTHRVYGLLTFVGVMYLVFQSIYTFAAPLMDAIESAFGWLGDQARPLSGGNPMVESFIVDGLIGGVGGVIVFLPQILILFLFISLLEGSGYLARAAFLMDRLLGWAGLNGRAFIPLLSSYACAIPGIMAARVMPDPKSRLATILVAPLMSCSARLPVYVVLIGAIIEPQFGAFWAGFTLFAMHFLGLVVAIPVVWLLNRKVLKQRRLPFVLELPPYQWPRARDVGLALLNRAKVFLKTAGTIILAMSIVIWAAGSFPRFTPADPVAAAAQAGVDADGAEAWVQQEQLSRSYLGQFGHTLAPAFAPAGFDWRITTAIFAAFPAREVVVPSLGILFRLGGDVDDGSDDLRAAMRDATWPDGRRLFTPSVAIGLMVFFALCAQCMATLAAVKRETNSWKWPAIMFGYMTGLAYVFAVAIHQIGKLFGV